MTSSKWREPIHLEEALFRINRRRGCKNEEEKRKTPKKSSIFSTPTGPERRSGAGETCGGSVAFTSVGVGGWVRNERGKPQPRWG